MAETGEPIITAIFKDHPLLIPEHRNLLQEDRVGAVMCVPVKLGERILGTLHIYRKRGYHFDEEALRLATSLADQAAVAIENAKLHSEAQRGLDFFRSVVDDNADAVMVLDLDRKIIHWNAGAEKLYGYTEKEALGKSIEIVVPPEERGTDGGEVVHSKGISTHFEADRLKKDGSLIPVSITISPVKNDKGKVIATSAVHKDLSERKKADEALRQSEKRFRNLVEFAGDAIFVNDFDGNADAVMVLDLDRKIIHWNAGAEKLYGYTEKEALGKSIEIVVPPEERGTDGGEVVHSKGISTHFEADRLKKDGSLIPVSITISPVKNDKGKVIATSAVHKDLSERKKADEALMTPTLLCPSPSTREKKSSASSAVFQFPPTFSEKKNLNY